MSEKEVKHTPDTPLMSINQAAAQGIERVRRPIWVMPEDHLKIDIIEGAPGPWVHLFSPFNKECNGRDPVDILAIDMDYDKPEWLPYDGPASGSEEYKAAQARFNGSIARATS